LPLIRGHGNGESEPGIDFQRLISGFFYWIYSTSFTYVFFGMVYAYPAPVGKRWDFVPLSRFE